MNIITPYGRGTMENKFVTSTMTITQPKLETSLSKNTIHVVMPTNYKIHTSQQ